MARMVCAICGCSLARQYERICSRCENILTNDKHDEVFEIMYVKTKCNSSFIKVGDYVNYVPDNVNLSKELKTNGVKWRIWAVNDDEVVIMPNEPVGRVALGVCEDFDKTFKSYKNVLAEINAECAKYGSRKALSVRSLKLDDLEEENISTLAKQKAEFVNTSAQYRYSEVSKPYTNGKFWLAQYNKSTGKNEILNLYRSATERNPVRLQQTYYFSHAPDWKMLDAATSEETYGTLLGHYVGWLASTCVNCNLFDADFGVSCACDAGVYVNYVLNSFGGTYLNSYGVHPLVTLSAKALKRDKASGIFATWNVD